MRLAQTEVYEVASFYHHFDIVKEGEAAPQALTVRVCDGLSCEMAGARELLERLPAILGRDVRVLHAPCIGRCEQAPGRRGRARTRCPTPPSRRSPPRCRPAQCATCPRTTSTCAAYRADGGYRAAEASASRASATSSR